MGDGNMMQTLACLKQITMVDPNISSFESQVHHVVSETHRDAQSFVQVWPGRKEMLG